MANELGINLSIEFFTAPHVPRSTFIYYFFSIFYFSNYGNFFCVHIILMVKVFGSMFSIFIIVVVVILTFDFLLSNFFKHLNFNGKVFVFECNYYYYRNSEKQNHPWTDDPQIYIFYVSNVLSTLLIGLV